MADRHSGHQTVVRFPDEVWERMAAAANDHNVAINWLINKACKEFVDNMIPADEMQWTRRR